MRNLDKLKNDLAEEAINKIADPGFFEGAGEDIGPKLRKAAIWLHNEGFDAAAKEYEKILTDVESTLKKISSGKQVLENGNELTMGGMQFKQMAERALEDIKKFKELSSIRNKNNID